MSYQTAISQLSLIKTYGWHGVKCDQQDELKPIPFVIRIISSMATLFDWVAPEIPSDVLNVAQESVATINEENQRLTQPEEENQEEETFKDSEELHVFFQSQRLFQDWNEFVTDEDLHIEYEDSISVHSEFFSNELFNCCYQTPQLCPLIVKPSDESIDLIEWATEHNDRVLDAIEKHGAIVFQGFPLNLDNFAAAFTAITGKGPREYQGDTPRQERKEKNVYDSTAVSPGAKLPLHQDESGERHETMASFIAFLCETPPEPGTGQTILGDAIAVTEDIKESEPDIWSSLNENSLTYFARYLPSHSCRTKWIRMLNPSHATIFRRFNTEDPEEIKNICKDKDDTCTWDGDWLVLSRENIPATVTINEDTTLFCNQLHVDILTPELCGGKLNYALARLLLYPTARSRQFDVQWSDGTPIEPSVPSRLLRILKSHEIVRDWHANDLLVLDNKRMMHGKNPHKGERRIHVALA